MNNENFNNQINGGMPTQTYNVPNNGNQGNKNTIFIIIGIVLVVIIGVLAYLAFGNKSNNAEPTNVSNVETAQPTQVSTSSFYKVNYNNFTLNIPDNLQYGEADEYLLIANESDTWEALFTPISGNFATLKQNSSKIIPQLQASGIEAKNLQTKTYNGVEFMTVEFSKSGTNGMYAYANLNSMYIAYFAIVSLDNEYDYSVLNDLATIVKSATYNSSSNSIKGNTSNVDFNASSIENLAK